MKKIYEYLSGNRILVKLIMVLIYIIGIYSLLNLKREVFPQTETDTMRVDIVYPGASPVDVN